MVLESNHASVDEMAAALESKGMTITSKEPGQGPRATVKAESTPTPASPEEQPGGTDGETAAVDPAETNPQETQAAPVVETPVVPTPVVATPVEPKTGEDKKFEPRRKQLERQVARLHEDLDLERGSKAALQNKLVEIQAELAKLKPAEPAKPEELVKPKRPTRAQHEYDEEKFEAAMAEYDSLMDLYHTQATAKAVSDTLAAEAVKQKKKEEEAEVGRFFDAYNRRLAEDRKDISDYQELAEDQDADFDIDQPDMFTVKLAIMESEHPAVLLRHFMLDARDNGAKELKRLSGMSDLHKAKELTRLEDRLVAEREAAKKAPEPVAVPAVVVAPVVPVVEQKPPEPAKPKPQAKPMPEPIEPLGSRAAARTQSLEGLTGAAYIAARRQGLNR